MKFTVESKKEKNLFLTMPIATISDDDGNEVEILQTVGSAKIIAWVKGNSINTKESIDLSELFETWAHLLLAKNRHPANNS